MNNDDSLFNLYEKTLVYVPGFFHAQKTWHLHNRAAVFYKNPSRRVNVAPSSEFFKKDSLVGAFENRKQGAGNGQQENNKIAPELRKRLMEQKDAA